MNIRSSALATIVLAIAYSFVLYYKQPDKLWDWATTLVGSGLSFFLAILGGLYLFNHQNKATAEASRKDLRELLCAEISDMLRILTDPDRMSLNLPEMGMTKKVLVAFVQPLMVEKAAGSGLFNRQETENLLHLARKARMYNFKVQHMMGVIQSSSNQQFVAHAADNVELTRKGTVDGLRQVASQLHLSINEQYPN